MFAHLMSGKVIILFTAAQQNLGLLLALSSGGKTGVWWQLNIFTDIFTDSLKFVI